MRFIKIKDLKKTNKGNTLPRTESQILSATKRMLIDNPMKKPINMMNQSQRMMGNQLWKLRIKQQPSSQVGKVM
jgi:hypothetical protein